MSMNRKLLLSNGNLPVMDSLLAYSVTITEGQQDGQGIALESPAFRLISSSNIGALASTATTAQLTSPSGKTGADFIAGQASCDINPINSLNPAVDDYTEVEFCFAPVTGMVVDTEQYDFRVVLSDGTPLDNTVLPRWTIGTGGGGSSTGTGAITFGAIVVDGSGLRGIVGTGSITLGALTVSGSAEREINSAGGPVDLVLPAITVSGSASVGGEITGTGSITLGPMTVSGTGTVIKTSSGAVTLGPIEVSGSAGIGAVGSGSITLGVMTVAGAGETIKTATGAITLGVIVVSGQANISIDGTGAITLGAVQVSGFDILSSSGGALLMARRRGRR